MSAVPSVIVIQLALLMASAMSKRVNVSVNLVSPVAVAINACPGIMPLALMVVINVIVSNRAVHHYKVI